MSEQNKHQACAHGWGEGIRRRDIKLLRDTLAMLCHFVWHRSTRPGEHMWSIPVDKERDFDVIISDAIDELEALRGGRHSPPDEYLDGLRAARSAVEPYANGEILLDTSEYVAKDILAEIERLIDARLKADPAEALREAAPAPAKEAELREALAAARDTLVAFQKQAGYLLEQGGYSTRMTQGEMQLAQAVAHIDRILAAPATAQPERCQCEIPDPVMQADGRFYCYTCSLQRPSQICERCHVEIVDLAREAAPAPARPQGTTELLEAATKMLDALYGPRDCTHGNEGDEDICDGCTYQREKAVGLVASELRAVIAKASDPPSADPARRDDRSKP